MEIIIWQLMQTDEYVTTLLAKDSSKKSSIERMTRYQAVFELNKTSMVEFKKSYQFYMEHPEITKVMFDSITARAGRQRSELYKSGTDSAVSHPTDTAVNRLKDSAMKHLGKLAAGRHQDAVLKPPAEKPLNRRKRK
jgi:Domain of unknown function (DUF4296)